MTTTATVLDQNSSAASTRGSNATAEPIMLRRRIGSTTFLVNVRFSSTGIETLEDKIHRLIKREVEKSA